VQVATQESGGTVTVSVNGSTACRDLPVTTTKSVSCALSPLADDDYTVTAVHAHAAGNPSAPGTANFHVDGTTTPTPDLTPPATLSGPASTDQTQPTLTIGGSAQGQVATVFEGTNPLCTATVGAGLTAICDAAAYLPGAELSVGDHTLTAVLAQGTALSQPSAPLAVEVVPTAPHLTSPTTVGTTQPLLAGSGATPLSTVTVADAGSGATACTALAG